jgi:hypothetical protein
VGGSRQSEDEKQNLIRSEDGLSFTLFKYQALPTQNQLHCHCKRTSDAGVEEVSVGYKNHNK